MYREDPVALLKGTKEYLQKHGRHRGSVSNPGNPIQKCLIGTLGVVADNLDVNQVVDGGVDLVSWLEGRVPVGLRHGPRRPIVNFNDFNATDEDVYDFLDKALADLGGLG